MFTRTTLVALALLVGISGAYSVAQVHKGQAKAKAAPLSASDKKLKKCELHGTLLKVDTVPIHYGIVGFPAGYYQASQRSFPHADSVVMGGCVIMPETMQTVKYCPQCRAAEKRWGLAHKWGTSKR
ncbi:hypothetical protein IAD21_04534 [Abditibacteriota bacterium]|nr:hypothetical protein IAD21_04534 [Abditibacteriota bacterium]